MKIANLKTIYICPDHNEKYHTRKVHMDNMLNTLGFKNFTYYKSSTDNYPTCLNKATIDILENNLDTPVLILEDDIEWTGINEVAFDPNIDAIYLGLSKSAGHPTNNIHLGESIFEKWSDTQVKIINMLSAHAILYISKTYKQAVIESLKNNMLFYNDIVISRLQFKFNVLANKKCVFYQSHKFNDGMHVENETKIEVNHTLSF
jgi:hypothetical protein